MNLPISLSITTKVASLQTQVTALSLTLVSIRTQIKQMELYINDMKIASKVDEGFSSTISLSNDEIDSDSDHKNDTNFDDDTPKEKKPIFRSKRKSKYVLVSHYHKKEQNSDDSGYDSEYSVSDQTPLISPNEIS